mmetsp:Transcript_19744/g.23509  ORF Transcript_19744/g.23509 Transcript_19744/m.23509 type:complete len:204 (+) Transcript_19744:43-654(+)
MLSILRQVRAKVPKTRLSPALLDHLCGAPQLKFDRKMSIMSSIQNRVDDSQKKQQFKQFKEQMKKMVEGPEYSLSSWGSELDEVMSSWKMMIPGSKSQPEVQRVIKFREILAKMTKEEKENPSKLLKNEAALSRIGAEASATADDVRSLIQQFESLVISQKWIRTRRKEGRRFPKDMEEMKVLIAADMKLEHVKKQRARMRKF